MLCRLRRKLDQTVEVEEVVGYADNCPHNYSQKERMFELIH